MSENELIALLRLQRIPHVGDVIAKRLIDRCGSAEAIFREKKGHLLKIDGVGTMMLNGLKNEDHLKAQVHTF